MNAPNFKTPQMQSLHDKIIAVSEDKDWREGMLSESRRNFWKVILPCAIAMWLTVLVVITVFSLSPFGRRFLMALSETPAYAIASAAVVSTIILIFGLLVFYPRRGRGF